MGSMGGPAETIQITIFEASGDNGSMEVLSPTRWCFRVQANMEREKLVKMLKNDYGRGGRCGLFHDDGHTMVTDDLVPAGSYKFIVPGARSASGSPRTSGGTASKRSADAPTVTLTPSPLLTKPVPLSSSEVKFKDLFPNVTVDYHNKVSFREGIKSGASQRDAEKMRLNLTLPRPDLDSEVCAFALEKLYNIDESLGAFIASNKERPHYITMGQLMAVLLKMCPRGKAKQQAASPGSKQQAAAPGTERQGPQLGPGKEQGHMTLELESLAATFADQIALSAKQPATSTAATSTAQQPQAAGTAATGSGDSEMSNSSPYMDAIFEIVHEARIVVEGLLSGFQELALSVIRPGENMYFLGAMELASPDSLSSSGPLLTKLDQVCKESVALWYWNFYKYDHLGPVSMLLCDGSHIMRVDYNSDITDLKARKKHMHPGDFKGSISTSLPRPLRFSADNTGDPLAGMGLLLSWMYRDHDVENFTLADVTNAFNAEETGALQRAEAKLTTAMSAHERYLGVDGTKGDTTGDPDERPRKRARVLV